MLIYASMAARKSLDFNQIAARVVAQATKEKPSGSSAASRRKLLDARNARERTAAEVKKPGKSGGIQAGTPSKKVREDS